MESVEIYVFKGKAIVQMLNNKRLRRMPSGCDGIAFKGLVYPLHHDDNFPNFINIDEFVFSRELRSCPVIEINSYDVVEDQICDQVQSAVLKNNEDTSQIKVGVNCEKINNMKFSEKNSGKVLGRMLVTSNEDDIAISIDEIDCIYLS